MEDNSSMDGSNLVRLQGSAEGARYRSHVHRSSVWEPVPSALLQPLTAGAGQAPCGQLGTWHARAAAHKFTSTLLRPHSAEAETASTQSDNCPQPSRLLSLRPSRFLRGAALTAAAAGALSFALTWSLSASLSSSPSAPVGPAAVTGHLALVRAHPALLELNPMLTPASFLVDATQALLSGALRCPPIYPKTLRHRREFFTAQILSAQSDGHATAEQAASARANIAFFHARDGRLEDARDAIVRLAAERPGDTTLRLFAAAFCRVLGRHEEGAQLLHDSAVPDFSRVEHKTPFVLAVHVATIGSAPRAVAGSEELVLVTTLGLLEMSMWSIFRHGDLLERLQVLALMAFLRGLVAKKLRRDDGPAPMQGS